MIRTSLHLLRRRNTEYAEAVTDHAPRCQHEGKARRGERRLLSDNAAFIVKRMKCARQLVTVARNALRCELRRRTRDLLGIGRNLLDKCDLRLIRLEWTFFSILHGNARLICLTAGA